MFELIRLRYKLNKEYFFSSSILLKDISEIHKKIIFVCYSFLKAIFLISIFLFIEMLILKGQIEPYFFDIGQLLFFLVCTLYYRSISDSENGKTRIKDFLVGTNFNHYEKIQNKKKIAGLFFFEASIFCFSLWVALGPLMGQVTPTNVLLGLILSLINLVSVYLYNYYSKKQIGSKYWFMQYILVGIFSYGIVQFWNYFNRNIELSKFEMNRTFFYLMICGLIYQAISILILFKKDKLKNQNIGGLVGDFIEKYLNNSAAVYAIPIIFLNIITVSQISKMLIIVAYISLFLMPNVMSLRFLNYYKIIGNSKNIIVNYGKMILFFQLILAIISGILCSLDIVYLVLTFFLLSGVTAFRIWVAVLVAKSKHEDGQKTDYYAISMFVPVMLLAAMAFFWR